MLFIDFCAFSANEVRKPHRQSLLLRGYILFNQDSTSKKDMRGTAAEDRRRHRNYVNVKLIKCEADVAEGRGPRKCDIYEE